MPTSMRQSGFHATAAYAPEDFPQISEVFDRVTAYSQRSDAGILEVTGNMLRASRAVIVAQDSDGQFSGFTRLISHASRDGQVSQITEVGTLWAPGRGAAKFLIDAATTHALAVGTIPVAVANEAALPRFAAAGFEPLAITGNGKTLMVHQAAPEAISPYEAAEAILDLPRFAGTSALQAMVA